MGEGKRKELDCKFHRERRKKKLLLVSSLAVESHLNIHVTAVNQTAFQWIVYVCINMYVSDRSGPLTTALDDAIAQVSLIIIIIILNLYIPMFPHYPARPLSCAFWLIPMGSAFFVLKMMSLTPGEPAICHTAKGIHFCGGVTLQFRLKDSGTNGPLWWKNKISICFLLVYFLHSTHTPYRVFFFFILLLKKKVVWFKGRKESSKLCH